MCINKYKKIFNNTYIYSLIPSLLPFSLLQAHLSKCVPPVPTHEKEPEISTTIKSTIYGFYVSQSSQNFQPLCDKLALTPTKH